MFLRIASVNTGGNRRKDAEALADRLAIALEGFPGYKGISFFADDNEGIYGTISHFESKEALETSNAVTRPLLLEAWGPEILESAKARTYDQYVPE